MDYRIKELCKEKGLLFKELAERLGITDVGLRQALKGNPTVSTLERIATALDVEVVDLFAVREDFIAFVRQNGKTYTFTDFDGLRTFVRDQPSELADISEPTQDIKL